VRNGEKILLLGKDSKYVVEVGKGKCQTKEGIVDLSSLRNKKFGQEIKTHLGKNLLIVKPTIVDFLQKSAKRLPQIIMPKDVALILAYTGINPGSLVVDAGAGSGFLSIFMAHYIKPGKIVTYEIEKVAAKLSRQNFKRVGMEKFIRLKQRDIRKGIEEKNVDLVMLDMKYAEKVVKHAYKSLKPGGWLVVYSPYIEQVKAVTEQIEKKSFSKPKTVENIVREWDVREHTLPARSGIMHTGFLTFARKVGK
jgi:tRNA (adenine57-N1/adenine58-N1)-methyltransferase